MISQLPRWVWAGAGGLAFLAGIVNAVGLLGFNHQAITHLTGTTSMLAAAAASGDVRQFLHLAAIIAGFFAGGVVGTIAFHHLGCATLYLPSGLAAATALACAASHRYHPPSAP